MHIWQNKTQSPFIQLEMKICYFFSLLIIGHKASNVDYASYQAISFKLDPKDPEAYSLIKNTIESKTSCQVLTEGLQARKNIYTALCSQHDLEKIRPFIANPPGTVTVSQLTHNRPHSASRNAFDDSKIQFDPDKYRAFEEMETWLNQVGLEDPKVQLSIIGHSYEKRPIYVAKISPEKDAVKPIIFLEAGVHAREWISPAVALALIDLLRRVNNSEG